MNDLLIRLWAWETVFPCDEGKPEGSLYIEAANRIFLLELMLLRLKAQLSDQRRGHE